MIKASATVTIMRYRGTNSITRYYKLQSSTASVPAKPTTNSHPSGWNDFEPSGTFSYSTVSKPSSYEAEKEAYNKAQ